MASALQAIKAELSKLTADRDRLDKQISALEAARRALGGTPAASSAKKPSASTGKTGPKKPAKKKASGKRSARLDAKTKAAIQAAVLDAAPAKGKTGVAKSVLVKAGSGAAKSASTVQIGSIIDALRGSKKLKMKGSRSKAVYTK